MRAKASIAPASVGLGVSAYVVVCVLGGRALPAAAVALSAAAAATAAVSLESKLIYPFSAAVIAGEVAAFASGPAWLIPVAAVAAFLVARNAIERPDAVVSRGRLSTPSGSLLLVLVTTLVWVGSGLITVGQVAPPLSLLVGVLVVTRSTVADRGSSK